jgi:hypothetical protein
MANVAMLGKSALDMKLWIPASLKVELLAYVTAQRLGLSDGIRKILVLKLLGADFHARWQVAVGLVPAHYREMEM